ncbi:hypothetical protein [Streptomyces bambusae]|uniref:Uncharacterized protein n=1 Tax=Streptomyces bambusae TaxID=1550616 RepID=A0ABS6Z3I8_9ACTN|nr:hypothetical protein [Streptomyces bambusae]MBW5482302.1 hypothetical protein [Streptomyces bambusae]
MSVETAWVEPLSSWLLGHGFSFGEEREADGFQNILLRFRRGDCEVHLTRERGEWRIGISPQGGDPVVSVNVWRCYLDGVDPDASEGPESIESELAFIYERVDDVGAAAVRDGSIGEGLLDINWIVVKARLGLDPEMPRPGGRF